LHCGNRCKAGKGDGKDATSKWHAAIVGHRLWMVEA
jgi:hypothetical protein